MSAVSQPVCRFKDQPEKLTVGDLFKLECQWPPAGLKGPLKLEAKTPYSLVILKEDSFAPGQALLTVTSYRPGLHQSALKLTGAHGKNTIFPALKWEVKSILDKDAKPYPPYGPWAEPGPVWLSLLLIVLILTGVSALFSKIYFAVQRKKLINKIKGRLTQEKAFPRFIGRLTALARKPQRTAKKDFIKEIDKNFRIFLENEFFISAETKTPKNIINQLKKYNPSVSQKLRQDILVFLKELNKNLIVSGELTTRDREQLLSMARNTAIKCYEKGVL